MREVPRGQMIRNKSPTVDELLEGSLSKEANRECNREE